MLRHNEHLIRFLQLTDLVHVLQITLAGIRPDKSIKKKREKNVMIKHIKALSPLNLLIADVITFIIIEAVRISKCSKLKSLLLKKTKKGENKHNQEPNFLRKFVVTLLLQLGPIKTESVF